MRLADDSASRIVKRYARRVGLEAASFSGNRLRSGFLTGAVETGANVFKLTEMSRTSRWTRCAATVRRVDLFKEHAGAAFL